MVGPYTGGCACGAIRYRTDSTPGAQVHCQCIDCQKRSGTGHSSYLTFESRADVDITGSESVWAVEGDSGHTKFRWFCPTCGTPVYVTFAAMPDLIAIHAGSLDDPSRFKPEVLTYKSRGLVWDTMDAGLVAFAKMPPG